MNHQRGWGAEAIGSDARPASRGGMVSLSRGELFDLTQGARARARRSFWGGIVLGGLIVGASFIAGAALAEETRTIQIGKLFVNGEASAPTTVSIAPSPVPGQWAVVSFQNQYVNDGGDDGTYTLTLDGVAVGIVFTWDFNPVLGSDRITVTPPEGITCQPETCEAVVMEGFSGEVILIDWRGM